MVSRMAGDGRTAQRSAPDTHGSSASARRAQRQAGRQLAVESAVRQHLLGNSHRESKMNQPPLSILTL